MGNQINTSWNDPVLNSVLTGLSSNSVHGKRIPIGFEMGLSIGQITLMMDLISHTNLILNYPTFLSMLGFFLYFKLYKGKGKIFYGQEPPSGESTTTECGFNYQLLAVIY